jgi:hypothetical protein
MAAILGWGGLSLEVARYIWPHEQGGDALGLVKRVIQGKAEVRCVAQWYFPGE